MNNQNINELITTLEKAVNLIESLPTPMGDSEKSNQVDILTIKLRELAHAKKPSHLQSFIDINY
ncbi:hypothetical protein [Citrobacter braakii]|uniref:hypothetical protein n=1 Tax=Citrobacter braakii TaxID=57706 RepID=UPI0037A589D2